MKVSNSTIPADLVKRLLLVLIPLTVLAAFWPTLRADFINWDDDANFLNNPHFRGLDWRNLRWMFTTLHMGNSHFQKALDLAPEYVVACANLGGALLMMGRGDEAIAQYQKALELRPDYAAAAAMLRVAEELRSR